MTTGTWPMLENSDSAATWIRGITKQGKPPRDNYTRMLRVVRLTAVCITLMVSLGWAALGAALLIW